MLAFSARRLASAAVCAVRTASPSGAALASVARSRPEAAACISWRRNFAAESAVSDELEVSPRVMAIADQVVALNLIEVSQLTALLREKLNLPADFGTGMMAMAPAGGSPATAPAEEKEEKTSFDLKLESFDAAAKIKVIKEIRSITELGLKEAKELVEGAPAMVKKGLKKEEAEEFKKKLEAVGAKVSLE